MKKLHWFLLSVFFVGTIAAQPQQKLVCYLETVDIATGEREVVLRDSGTMQTHIEAPNWSRGGTHLLVNKGGRLYRVPFYDLRLTLLYTDFATACNNDHGFTFDGKTLLLSHHDAAVGGESRIFKMPLSGGPPVLITENYPSYWHGVSPDGQTVVYCAGRNDEWDVYAVSIDGGPERRLTDAPGLDDGPEYSPDGRYIYFNSHRTGRMQIWRMNADGTSQTQITDDEYDNWFAHPSPDGRWLVYISYLEDQQGQHPFGKDVKLRLMNLETGEISDLTEPFFGGQGTINVPSWSPDSRRLAFVRYELF